MSLKKIIRKNIEDDAVTSPKLSSDAVTSAKLSTDFITGQSELAEQAANDDVLLIYDSSAGALKKVSKANTTVLESPTVSSISPTTVNSPSGSTTFTITGTGFTAGTNARLIASTGRVRNFDTVTRDSTTQLTVTISNSVLSVAESAYSIQVINGTGLADVLASQVDFNQVPTFVTASGSLGSNRFSMSGVEVNATDPDSISPVTFELQSGSLPPGISITNTGANGGTATFTGTFSSLETSDTVYNFTLRAVDASSNTSSRAFSFTALGPQVESFTSSGTFSVPSGVSSVEVLVVAGGGGGGGAQPDDSGGGGGAGGLIFVPGFPVTPGGTVSVTVGCGGTGGANDPGPSPNNGVVGQDSTFGTLVAKGGGGGKSQGITSPGSSGGSGGGGAGEGCQGPSAGAPGTQPTQPGQSGAYGFGNPGGRNSPSGSGVRGNGGGGGGAGAAGGCGQASNPGRGGPGGTGKAYTIADGTTPVYYAGGGGGGSSNGQDIGGGQGGGANASNSAPAQQGSANTGGGAGAGHRPGGSGGTGGKGIVIVRY